MKHTAIYKKKIHSLLLKVGLGAVSVAAVAGCAGGALLNPNQRYGVHFESLQTHPVGFIQYKVAAGDRVMWSRGQSYVKAGRLGGGGGYYGAKPKPTSIYVKWREDATGLDYEDSVDFSKAYQDDLNGKTIVIMPVKDKLTILIYDSKELPKSKCPANWPNSVQTWPKETALDWAKRVMCSYAITQVYPTYLEIYKED